MRFALTAGIVAALAWTATFAAIDGDPSTLRHDVDGDGTVTVLDLYLVASAFGQTGEPNPCVKWVEFDDDTRPTATVINSLGEVVENPRGGHYLIPADHPEYRQPNPMLWACP